MKSFCKKMMPRPPFPVGSLKYLFGTSGKENASWSQGILKTLVQIVSRFFSKIDQNISAKYKITMAKEGILQKVMFF